MSLILDEHRHYLSDLTRISAFQKAINEVVKPGDTVLDLGSGTGILALLACRAGALRVYAVDEGGIIELARKLAQANGYQDKIVFIRGHSTRISLPEKVDVIVADQIGRFGFDAGILQYFADARRRFLKGGGLIIPSSIDLWVAPVECYDRWDNINTWNASCAGFDFRPARTIASNTSYPFKFRSEHLLGLPETAATLELLETSIGAFQLQASSRASRSGVLHGIGGWFSAQLSPNVTISNSPLIAHPIDRMNLFFPIDSPVRLLKGDRVQISMHVMPADLVITWKVEVWSDAEEHTAESPVECKGSFLHSSWKGMLNSKEDLQKTSPGFVPSLTPRGEARLTVLELCDGRRTISEIEKELYRRFANVFESPDEASVFVAEVVTRYSR